MDQIPKQIPPGRQSVFAFFGRLLTMGVDALLIYIAIKTGPGWLVAMTIPLTLGYMAFEHCRIFPRTSFDSWYRHYIEGDQVER